MSDDTDHEEFIDLVKRMRQAQKDYKSWGFPETLKISRELETEVDTEIFKHNCDGAPF